MTDGHNKNKYDWATDDRKEHRCSRLAHRFSDFLCARVDPPADVHEVPGSEHTSSQRGGFAF